MPNFFVSKNKTLRQAFAVSLFFLLTLISQKFFFSKFGQLILCKFVFCVFWQLKITINSHIYLVHFVNIMYVFFLFLWNLWLNLESFMIFDHFFLLQSFAYSVYILRLDAVTVWRKLNQQIQYFTALFLCWAAAYVPTMPNILIFWVFFFSPLSFFPW
jgi:hypothetical protein